jgi:hypothetical protein
LSQGAYTQITGYVSAEGIFFVQNGSGVQNEPLRPANIPVGGANFRLIASGFYLTNDPM